MMSSTSRFHMGVFQNLFARLLYGGTRSLRSHEQAVLDAFKNKLSGAAIAVLNRQLARLNLVQRSPDGRLVSFFDTSDRTAAAWSVEELFPLRLEETRVARIWVKPSNHPPGLPEMKVEIVLHRGRLSSVEFSQSPEPLENREVRISEVELIQDPMKQVEAQSLPASLSEIEPNLRERLKTCQAADLRKPLAAAERERFARAVDAKLPRDYLELTEATEGAMIHGWRVYGLSQIRKIVQRERSYYILAESPDLGAVGVVQGGNNGELYLIGSEDQLARPIGTTLSAWLSIA